MNGLGSSRGHQVRSTRCEDGDDQTAHRVVDELSGSFHSPWSVLCFLYHDGHQCHRGNVVMLELQNNLDCDGSRPQHSCLDKCFPCIVDGDGRQGHLGKVRLRRNKASNEGLEFWIFPSRRWSHGKGGAQGWHEQSNHTKLQDVWGKVVGWLVSHVFRLCHLVTEHSQEKSTSGWRFHHDGWDQFGVRLVFSKEV